MSIVVTPAAVAKLKALIAEHPEDPVVRIALRIEGPESRHFQITLETEARPGDAVQDAAGVTVAIDGENAWRMEGVTLDYAEPGGFKFLHPPAADEPLHQINLN
jgi:Fe-S cluster assembly iron-binding protein IscA